MRTTLLSLVTGVSLVFSASTVCAEEAAVQNPTPAASATSANSKAIKPPFHIGSKFSRGLQKYTGVNFLTEVVASQAAKAVIKKKVGGKVKVKVQTYSLTDLIAGKVKAVDVKVEDPNVNGFGAGDYQISSDSPFWYAYRGGKGRKTGMKAPVLMTVRAQLSEKQIEEALNSTKVAESLRGLKLDLPGLGEQTLQVLKPKVDINGEQITLDATLVVQGQPIDTGVPIKISARPRLEGDRKIILDDLKVDSDGIVEPDKFAAFAETLLNPVIDFARLDRKDHAFRMANFKVSGQEVSGDGKLLLTPRP